MPPASVITIDSTVAKMGLSMKNCENMAIIRRRLACFLAGPMAQRRWERQLRCRAATAGPLRAWWQCLVRWWVQPQRFAAMAQRLRLWFGLARGVDWQGRDGVGARRL